MKPIRRIDLYECVRMAPLSHMTDFCRCSVLAAVLTNTRSAFYTLSLNSASTTFRSHGYVFMRPVEKKKKKKKKKKKMWKKRHFCYFR